MDQNDHNSKFDQPELSLYLQQIETALGAMYIVSSLDQLYLLEFTNRKNIDKSLSSMENLSQVTITEKSNNVIEQVKTALKEYFEHSHYSFSLPLCMVGTNFQKKVWNALMNIQPGQTISYSELAHQLEIPQATRAVANAVAQNRMAIIIPCHRVIGKGGNLRGYAGGIERKKWLLNHEAGHRVPRPEPL